MRIASNKVKDLLSFFHTELKNLYSQSEIDELAFRVFEHYCGFKREYMKSKLEDNINQSELILIYDAAKKLATAEPLQYVLGESYFYKFPFYVNKQVLIPRPETEELVELIFKENKNAAPHILDLGTGSGCIPVSLKCLIPKARVEACDISGEALQVAGRNAERNKAEVRFFKADVLNLPPTLPHFDMIVSNPPYIKHNEAEQIHDNVKKHEPHLALFVEGDDAIIFYRKIIDLAVTNLNPNGKLYFELNPLTAEEVKMYALSKKFFSEVELLKDISGNVRFLRAVR